MTTRLQKSLLVIVLLFVFKTSHAQIEVAYLNSKGYSAIGFGGFLNFSFPVTEGDAIIAEAGVQSFSKDSKHIAMVPFLLGYRYTMDRSGAGFYLEPSAGYSIGGTDIQKTDANGSVIYQNGRELDQKVAGVTVGLGAGYLFEGNAPFNVSLRLKHTFVSGDPSINIIALRVSHPLWRRRDNR
jgi:hypothetical protein